MRVGQYCRRCRAALPFSERLLDVPYLQRHAIYLLVVESNGRLLIPAGLDETDAGDDDADDDDDGDNDTIICTDGS